MSQHKRSHELWNKACEVIPGGVNTSIRRVEPTLAFMRSQGAIITDADGNDYIDYHAAFGPIILGHNFEAVNCRVAEVMQKMDLLGTGLTGLEVDLARKICQHVPSAEKVLFCNSGAEATYHAVRLARAVTGRKKLLKFHAPGYPDGFRDDVSLTVSDPNLVAKAFRRAGKGITVVYYAKAPVRASITVDAGLLDNAWVGPPRREEVTLEKDQAGFFIIQQQPGGF